MNINNFGKGCIQDIEDKKDFIIEEILGTPELFNWSKGFDIEDKVGKIKVESQGKSSSCFPSNTQVLMEDFDYKKISKIKKGDKVFTHKGNIETVSETMKRKWQGTMKIMKLWGDYRKIEATPEHPFYAIKKPRTNRYKDIKGKTTWIKNEELLLNQAPDFYQIKDLERGDWVAMPFNNIVKDKIIYSIERNPEFLWLLGLYMADGSISKYGVVLSLHKKEFEWYERIKTIMKEYDTNITYSFKGENGLSIIINGEKWSKLFLELGGKLCDKKEINKRLMFLEPHLQMKIYEGIADGDGCYTNKSTTIVSTSKKMLLQCRTILLRNGIFSSFQKRKENEDKKQVWVLETTKNESRYSFIRNGYIYAQIKELKHNKAYAGGNVYNIEVEKDNSYIVNGVAVHNCVGQAWSYYLQVLETIEKEFTDLSAKDIYSRIFQPQGGASLRDGAKIAVNRGVAKEASNLSYMEGKPPTEAFMREIIANLEEEAEQFKSKSYATTTHNSIDFFASYIRDHHGLVSGVIGDNAGWRDGIVKPPKSLEWGHALYFGKAKLINGKKYLGFINSWGTEWGDNGWGWLGQDYFGTVNYQNVLFNIWTLIDLIDNNNNMETNRAKLNQIYHELLCRNADEGADGYLGQAEQFVRDEVGKSEERKNIISLVNLARELK